MSCSGRLAQEKISNLSFGHWRYRDNLLKQGCHGKQTKHTRGRTITDTTAEKCGTPFFCFLRKWTEDGKEPSWAVLKGISTHSFIKLPAPNVSFLPAPGCLQGMQTFVWDIQNHFSCSKAISTYMLGLSKTDPAALRASEGITQKPITDFNLDDHDGGSGGGGWEMDRFNSRVVKGMRWNWW